MKRPVVWRFVVSRPEASEPVPFGDTVEWFNIDDPTWEARLNALEHGAPPQLVSVDLAIGTLPLQVVLRSVQAMRARHPLAMVVEAVEATSLSPVLIERVMSQATLVVMFNATGVLNTLSAELCEAGAESAVVLGANRWRASVHAPQVKGLLDAGLNGPKTGFSVAVATHALANGFCHADAITLGLAGTTSLPDLFLDCSTATPPFAPPFASLADARLGLYAIVDSADWIERVVAAGARTVQLRAKQGTSQQLSEEVRRSVRAAEAAGAQLFINDHWKLALQHGAYGVHLGQEDTLVADLDALRVAGVRVGLSSHCAWEVARAQALKPSYIACGPIHATVTKDMPWWPQGPGNLAYWSSKLPTPVVAIAGMDEARSTEAVQCGAAGVAVLRGIVQSTDLQGTIARLKSAVDAGRVLERIAPPEWPRSTLAGPVPPPWRQPD